MNAALDDFADASLWSMSIHQGAALVIAVEKLANRVDSMKVAVFGASREVAGAHPGRRENDVRLVAHRR